MLTAGFLRLVTHPRVFVEPIPLAAAQEFMAALLAQDGVEWIDLGEEWLLLEALCRHTSSPSATAGFLPPRQLTLLSA
jgi:hypothetical protein